MSANSRVKYLNQGSITGEKKIYIVRDNVTLEHLKLNFFFSLFRLISNQRTMKDSTIK